MKKKVKVQCLKEDDAREQRVIANYLPERKRSVQKWIWMKVKVNGMTVEVNRLKVKWIKSDTDLCESEINESKK